MAPILLLLLRSKERHESKERGTNRIMGPPRRDVYVYVYVGCGAITVIHLGRGKEQRALSHSSKNGEWRKYHTHEEMSARARVNFAVHGFSP